MPLTLFLRTRYFRDEGKACRAYTIQDEHGEAQFTATAFRVPGRITVHAAGVSDRPILVAIPRRSFPLTGRYDVRDGAEDRLLGVITRSGRFYDPRGRRLGRFRDARTWKEHAGIGILTIVVEGMIAGESAASDAGGTDRFVIVIDGAPVGALRRERVPFDTTPAVAPPGRLARVLRTALPKRLGAWFERRPPYAWKLDVGDTGGVPDLLLLAAAILAIEIALW